ncbi:MAG: hypothetical protein IKL32_00990 [Alphaproteobacteria bacterium]|jgi:hypothetical protein|nr:hypothetical protein [Alphaproteobacteria bacterium]
MTDNKDNDFINPFSQDDENSGGGRERFHSREDVYEDERKRFSEDSKDRFRESSLTERLRRFQDDGRKRFQEDTRERFQRDFEYSRRRGGR